jgi:uncharacterized protein YeaO (DUF488 family)
VRKTDYASRDYYDAWLPELAPSAALVGWLKHVQPVPDKDWALFAKRYRAEMKAPEAQHLLTALARLSQAADFSVGCYCERPDRCHRSILEELLREHGADIAGP